MQKQCEKSSSFDFFLPDEKNGGVGGATAQSSPVVDVSPFQVSTETPVSPAETGRGAAGIRKRIRKPRPEYIRDARRHIERAYFEKTGRVFGWTPLFRANLRHLAGKYRAFEIMALWDLYLSTERSIYTLYYMERSLDHLWANPQFKPLCRQYEDFLLTHCRAPK